MHSGVGLTGDTTMSRGEKARQWDGGYIPHCNSGPRRGCLGDNTLLGGSHLALHAEYFCLFSYNWCIFDNLSTFCDVLQYNLWHFLLLGHCFSPSFALYTSWNVLQLGLYCISVFYVFVYLCYHMLIKVNTL